MRVLVIGGTGLISTAIVAKLHQEGHDTTLYNRGQQTTRLSQEVPVITGDRQDFDAFATEMHQHDFDAVIDMITFNAQTAANAVEVFQGRIQHYLFTSTVCVYGGPLSQIPATESEPHTPIPGYGQQKSEAEAVFNKAWQTQDFPVTHFRPSHCYGPGAALLDIWGYNPCLVNRIREGKPIIVPGDGFGAWQPGHINDMAKGFVGALGKAHTFGEAYNLVGDEIMDWRSFHERMAKAIGCEANIVPMTTEQILAGSKPDHNFMLKDIFQYPAAYTSDKIKRDIPEYTDLMTWENGVVDTVQWMDENNIHEPTDTQPWIDGLVATNKNMIDSLSS